MKKTSAEGVVLLYFIDFAKTLTKQSNIGVFIYLILNTLLVVALFSGGFNSIEGVIFGVVIYVLSLVLALSPFGEWILRLQTGCKKIKRKEYINRLEPLFLDVLEKARKVDPSIPEDIRLFMSNDTEPNAFATGRKTVCITKGFLDYSDEEIKAVFAHEIGHLAHKDTDLILVITVGNMIVTAIFIIYRVIIHFFAFLVAIGSRNFGPLIINFMIDVVLVALMWLWTKLGMILIMHSSRKNEFLADEFAYKLGYGDSLAAALDTLEGSDSKGLWANLASTHPDTDDRIARLQELGSSYRRKTN